MRHIQLRLANPEMNHMTLKMPGNRQEMDCVIHNRFTYLSGREVMVTQCEPLIITNELEIEFCSLMPGLLTNDITEQIMVEQQSVQKGMLPEITNICTPESVDRYLFDHPLEPMLEKVLEKHGYYRAKDTVMPEKSQTVTAASFLPKATAVPIKQPVKDLTLDMSIQI